MNLLLWGGEIDAAHLPVIEALAAAGFDGVEIPVTGQSIETLKAFKRCVADSGMALTTSTFVPPDVNPIDPNPAVRGKSVDYMKARIDECALLGGNLLIGGLYQAHKYFTGLPPSSDEWGWSRDYLRAAGEYAAQANIRLGLEFLNRFEVHLINTAADAKRMCEDVGLANIGVLYDTHHANIEDPAPAHAIGGLGDHLFHIHLSESHRGTLGTGQVPWADTFRALSTANYSGWLTIEAFGTIDPGLSQAANVWRNAFDSEEQLYTDGLAFIRQQLAALPHR
ncbi:MAG: sugar phosphate isomerase/epimerase family protein [Alphaproteobacteria bacterium]